MNRKIKYIYFDIGGVLLNWRNSLYKLAQISGKDYEDIYKVFKKYDDLVCKGTLTSAQLWDLYKKTLNIKIEIDDFAQFRIENFIPIKETHDLIVKLFNYYPIGLITNIFPGDVEKLLKKKQIPDLKYYHIIQSHEVRSMKPEKKIFDVALRKANVRPSEVLLIDDSQKNIKAAKKFGWNTLLFDEKNPTQSAKEILDYLKIK